MTPLIYMHDKLPVVVDGRLVVTAEEPLPCPIGRYEEHGWFEDDRDEAGELTGHTTWHPCGCGDGLAPVGTVVIHGHKDRRFDSGDAFVTATAPALLMVTTLTSQVKLCNCHESEQCATGTKGRWRLSFDVVEVFSKPITEWLDEDPDFPHGACYTLVASLPSGVSVAPSGLYEAVTG